MAKNLKIAALSANAAADAIGARCNSGTLLIYSGTQPANADAVPGAGTLLATLTFASTAFGAASGGVATAAAITKDPAADDTGIAAWFRVLTSGAAKVMDGSVGTTGCDLNVATVSFVAGAEISITSMTITMPLA